MDGFIDSIEWIAAFFIGLVALDVFISIMLRYFFGYTIPDAYDFGQLLLGILIFWGIAATSYRGTHITVDLLWAALNKKWKRIVDVFATLVLLFVVGLAVLRHRLDRRCRGRAAHRGPHLSPDLPSRIPEAGRRSVEVGRVRHFL
jgi:TRAP-type mannitol/chloroaromatic compound transport system permease small subunit